MPADIRILQANGFKIEASAITGEPAPREYTHEVAASHVSLFDARNVAFKGSYCTEGDAIGLVIRTGQYTVRMFLEEEKEDKLFCAKID